jgi:hypothetical protein
MLSPCVHRLAALGWRLFPCAPRDKVPLLKGWPRLASSELTTIRRWGTQYPACNWAVLCGADSRVWVLDVDGEDGSASLRSLIAQHGDYWTRTLAVTTARGQHLYFSYPSTGVTIRNSAGKLGAGLDVRGDSGYVLIPPSVHPTGALYQWTSPMKGNAPASAPGWLLEMLASTVNPTAQTRDFRVLLQGIRNDGLTRLAGAMRRRGATPEEIEAVLLDHNSRRCRPPLPNSEVQKIVTSVSRYPPGGPDPLERAWQVIQAEIYPSNYEKFLALARQLQLARRDQTIALPLQRIATLMGLHWTMVGIYRKAAVKNGVLLPAGGYIPHRRAGIYRFSLGEL